MSEELKACGHCDGDTWLETLKNFCGWKKYKARCKECRIETPLYDTKQEAIKAWNTMAIGWMNVFERLYVQCQEATSKDKTSRLAESEDCPISDGCCPECNYFGFYIEYIQPLSEPPEDK